jgi:hypothetical protein
LTKQVCDAIFVSLRTGATAFLRFYRAIMAKTIDNIRSLPRQRPRIQRITAADIFSIMHGRSVPIFWRRAR